MKVTLEIPDWTDATFAHEVVTATAAFLTKTAKQDILKAAFAEAQSRARAAVIEATEKALQTELRETNTYGEPRGEPITFREFVITNVSKYLEQRVNQDGKTTSYHGDQKMTRAQWLVRDACTVIFEELLRPIKADIRKAVDEKLAAELKDMISKEIGTRKFKVVETRG